METENNTTQTNETQPKLNYWQRLQQQAQQAQQAYNDFRQTYGKEPDDQQLNDILGDTKRWAVQSTLLNGPEKHRARWQTVLGANGAFFGDMDKYTRNALEQNYQQSLKQQAQQEQQNNTFTQRTENGSLPQDTQAYTLSNGRQVTGQDIQALQYLLKQSPSPERDQAINNALQQYYNINLPQEGTIEQRITNLLNTPVQDTPVEGETEEQKQQRLQQAQADKDQTDDALAFLLTQAGATFDQNGQLILPQQLSEQEARQKVDDLFRKEDKLRAHTQINNIDRQRNRQSLAALGRIIGEMIQAAGGAQVLPNELTAAYNQLNQQQQQLYDNYWARMEADRQRNRKREQDLEDAARKREQDLGDMAKERAWRERMYDRQQQDETKREERLIRRRTNINHNKKEDEFEFVFSDGTSIPMKGESGNAKVSRVLGYMLKNGLIPLEDITDQNGKVDPRVYANAKAYVYAFMYAAQEDPKHEEAIYKILTGKDRDFGQYSPNLPQDKGGNEQWNLVSRALENSQRQAPTQKVKPGNVRR